MQGAQAAMLSDGRRLHLHHGPIDLIVEAFGPGRDTAYRHAAQRFETVLPELVNELAMLRKPADPSHTFAGDVARQMQRAVLPHLPHFITPMAAVAGAVADEIVRVIGAVSDVHKAYVNNGGDVAFMLAPGEVIKAVIAAPQAGDVVIQSSDPWRGIATSGWRGRSHSLGIADAVTVIARTAADADAAATMIANAVDLPGHPAIERMHAETLAPDSDLGARLVTTRVGPLLEAEASQALQRGATFATNLLCRKLIGGALLQLNGQIRMVGSGAFSAATTGALVDA